MIKKLSQLILIALFIISCQKGIDGDIVDNGNGNGTTPPAGVTTYQPVSKDSYWKYKMYGSTIPESTSTLTSTGQQQTFDGIIYNLYSVSPATSGFETNYLGNKDHNYYTRAKGFSPNTGAPFDLTFLYMNDANAVGYKWNVDAGQGNGFTAKILGEIKGKNISLTVGSKTFSNVIHSSIDLQYVLPGLGQLSFITYDYFVAKDIGIVRIITRTPAPAVTELFSDLIEYNIK